MFRNVNFLSGSALAFALAAGSAWADEGTTEAQVTAYEHDESGFVLSIGGGLGVEGEAEASGVTLNVGEAGIVEGSLAYKFNDRFRAGVVVQYETADINLAVVEADAHLWNVMAFGELDAWKGDGAGFYGRVAYGLSKGTVGFAMGDADLDDGKTLELALGYRGDFDGHESSVRVGYVDTSELDVGGFTEVDYGRWQIVGTYALSRG